MIKAVRTLYRRGTHILSPILKGIPDPDDIRFLATGIRTSTFFLVALLKKLTSKTLKHQTKTLKNVTLLANCTVEKHIYCNLNNLWIRRYESVYKHLTDPKLGFCNKLCHHSRVVDPDPDWIRIQ
jgi:hypothetical protein